VNAIKYIGMDVHLATISIVVLDAAGRLIMELAYAGMTGARGETPFLCTAIEFVVAASPVAGALLI
jgi:hypothetical protein